MRVSGILALVAAVGLGAHPAFAAPERDDGPLGTRDLNGPWPEDDLAAAFAAYSAWGRWEMLYARAQGIERLARTRATRALRFLSRRYAKPRKPFALEERYLIASSLRHFRGASRLPGIEALAKRWGRKDPWLLYQVFCLEASQGRFPAERTLNDDRTPALGAAAALEASAACGAPDRVAETVSRVLKADRIGRNAVEQRLWIGACVGALRSLQDRSALVIERDLPPLVDVLDRDDVAPLSKRLIARFLSLLLRVDADWIAAAPWRRFVAPKAEQEPPAGRTRTRPRPEFMGTRVRAGRRIVYAIDLSDSMLAPLSPREKQELVRERGSSPQGTSPSAGKREGAPPFRWGATPTRLDAVRFHLAESVQQLDSTSRFAVIAFGDDARLFDSTPRLVSPTSRVVGRLLRELRGIRPRSADDGSRGTRLMGQTDLHSALRLAYRVTTHGIVPEEEAAHGAEALAEGADAIFVLSDGQPNRDAFPGESAPLLIPAQEGRTGRFRDPETGDWKDYRLGPSAAYVSKYVWFGPYRHIAYFRRDLERLNLFRKVEISAVGFGEADRQWLRACVEAGDGELNWVGGPDEPSPQ